MKVQERAEELKPSDVPQIDPGRFHLIQQAIIKPTKKEYFHIYNAHRRLQYQTARKLDLTSGEARRLRSFDPREYKGVVNIIRKYKIEPIREIAEELNRDTIADIFEVYRKIIFPVTPRVWK